MVCLWGSAERRGRTTPARLCLSYLTKRLLCCQRWRKLSLEVKLKVEPVFFSKVIRLCVFLFKSKHVFHHSGFFADHSGSVLKPYKFKMEEIEGFRYRCRVSVPHQELSVLPHNVALMSIDFLVLVLLSCCEAECVLCLCPGRHALGDQAGSEGGQAEGDQAGAAKLRKTQSKWRLLVCRDLPGDVNLS